MGAQHYFPVIVLMKVKEQNLIAGQQGLKV